MDSWTRMIKYLLMGHNGGQSLNGRGNYHSI
jgi:hypothetical protein